MSCHANNTQGSVVSVVCVTQDTTGHHRTPQDTTPQHRMTGSCRPWLWVRKYQGEREERRQCSGVVYCILWCVVCSLVVVLVWCCVVVGSPHILNIDQLTADHSAHSVDVC